MTSLTAFREGERVPFESNLIDFRVSKLLSGHTAWVNPDSAAKLGFVADLDTSDLISSEFFNKFGFAIADNDWIDDLKFDTSIWRYVKAERYGGLGIGDHGGGVRVGNFGPFQVKGIGRNLLCGSASNVFHSYGALNACEAIFEAIYSKILNKILPAGAVAVHGIIITTRGGAYYEHNKENPDGTPGWGALLVRDALLRPSHFLRAGHYGDDRAKKLNILPDAARVRRVVKELYKSIGSDENIAHFLQHFVQTIAHQFSMARVARIAHGSVSSSNIALNGAWVDLACATFVRGGENSGYITPFYQEPSAGASMARELIETIAKYMCVRIRANDFIDYFYKQYSCSLVYHCAYLFGISHESLADECRISSYPTLANTCLRVIESAQKVSVGYPTTILIDDPVIALVEGLFLSLANTETALERFSRCKKLVGISMNDAIHQFRHVIGTSIRSTKKGNRENMIICSMVVALNRLYMPEFFYKNRLDHQIRDLLDTNDSTRFGPFIHEVTEIANWSFSSLSEYAVLFSLRDLKIFFNAETGGIEANFNSKEHSFTSPDDAAIWLDHIPSAALTCAGFCFRDHIKRLIRFINLLRDFNG